MVNNRLTMSRDENPCALCCLLLLIATTATAEPIAPGAIQVLEGDTIAARGKTVRLVGSTRKAR